MRTRLALWLVTLFSVPVLLGIQCQPAHRVVFTSPTGTTGAGTQVTIGPPAPAPAAEEAPAGAVPAEP